MAARFITIMRLNLRAMHGQGRFHSCWLWVLALGLAGGSLALVSCATNTGKQASPPRPGQGLAEYRRLAEGARDRVDATVQALEALARPAERAPHPALPKFDEALHQLEVRSVTTRARAEAIRTRGAAYFEEWKEHLPPPDTAEGRAMSGQFNRLHQHFEAVRAASDAARDEFKPFLPALRDLRETLESAPTVPATVLEQTTANGRRLRAALDHVMRILDEAAVELRASIQPPAKP